jgi:hypothetical protein
MAYVQPLAPGFRYGLAPLSGAGSCGQLVKLAGPNLLAVNTTPAARSFGILEKPYRDGELAGVFCLGGIYETDQFEGTPAPGNELACDATTGKLKVKGQGEFAVGETISCVSGVLRFKLFV